MLSAINAHMKNRTICGCCCEILSLLVKSYCMKLWKFTLTFIIIALFFNQDFHTESIEVLLRVLERKECAIEVLLRVLETHIDDVGLCPVCCRSLGLIVIGSCNILISSKPIFYFVYDNIQIDENQMIAIRAGLSEMLINVFSRHPTDPNLYKIVHGILNNLMFVNSKWGDITQNCFHGTFFLIF